MELSHGNNGRYLLFALCNESKTCLKSKSTHDQRCAHTTWHAACLSCHLGVKDMSTGKATGGAMAVVGFIKIEARGGTQNHENVGLCVHW